MSKPIKLIEELLYLQDCVVIPDFGGFVCNYIPAGLDDRTGTIVPPVKKVIFNKQLRQNDGLLIQWITEREGINYSRAQKRLKHFTDEIKATLNRGETFVFGSIGSFRLDKHFHLNFNASEHNFLPDTMGMEQFRLLPSVSSGSSPEKPFAPTQNNIIGSLLKYGLSAATIAGIIIITQLDIFKSHPNTGMAGIHSTSSQTIKADREKLPIVSPDCDYVDFDPFTHEF